MSEVRFGLNLANYPPLECVRAGLLAEKSASIQFGYRTIYRIYRPPETMLSLGPF